MSGRLESARIRYLKKNMQINIILTGGCLFGEGDGFEFPTDETHRASTSDSDEELSQSLAWKLLQIRA